ncbi:MAG: tetratricopeptide repeat protein [candidate division Zixibacteria bacterium]|nr:tetratricopeptide repeat protein [candidate division Zixibacteria bacterium]
MSRIYSVVSVVLAASLAAPATLRAAEPEMTAARYWAFVENIQVTGDAPEVRLWVALPMNRLGQKVEIGEIYPEPAAVVDDPLGGNRVILWRLTDLEGADEAYAYYDFKFAGEEVNANVDPSKIEPYDEESAAYQRYTRSEPWVEVTDAIVAQAGEIVGDETNPYHKAKKIFDWVVYNIRYESPDYDHCSATKSFARRAGDCGGFSVIFCALCRAAGVPARTVTACWTFGGGHQWAEVLLPPYGWVPADTSVAQMFVPGGSIPVTQDLKRSFAEIVGIPVWDANWLFGNLYPNRLVVLVGNNFQFKDAELGVGKVFRCMRPGVDDGYPAGIEYVGLSGRTVSAGCYVFGEGRDDAELARKKASHALATAYVKAGEYAKAERLLLAALEEDPEAEAAWLELGKAYLGQDRLDDAIDALREGLAAKAASAKPVADVQCRSVLGECYLKKGDLEAARREFMQVIESGIDYEDILASAETHLDEITLATE